MSKQYIIAGMILLIAVAYISFSSIRIITEVENISLVYRTEGFSGYQLKISAKEIDTVFDKAKVSMEEHAANYTRWETITVSASWISFILNGLIALIAGYLGFTSQSIEQTTASVIDNLKNKNKTAKMIGLMAALTTILTGLSVKAKEISQQEKAKAMEIRDTVIASYKDIQKATTEEEARTVIEKLRLISQI